MKNNESQSLSNFDKLKNWLRHSAMLKLVTIAFLMIVLMIPQSMIKSVINERQNLNRNARIEVTSKWSSHQQITGPILTIPIVYQSADQDKLTEWTENLHVMPENLEINGEIFPEILQRGIHKVAVYKSKLKMSGNFKFDEYIDRKNLKEILFNSAFVTIGISDLKGIKDNIVFRWNNENTIADPGSKISKVIASGVTIHLEDTRKALENDLTFDFELDLKGSETLSFVPVGGNTSAKLISSWNAPSFNGNFLPENRVVTDEGFEADWKILKLNRNFPQIWSGSSHTQNLSNAAFGVELLLLDDYQKSLRSAKYAIMTIALTFLIFFLIEILSRTMIHPFQYTLVGLALCLFYILLISISEHSNFNIAFLIATICIIIMITLYASTIFKSKQHVILLFGALCCLYAFLFTTLQLTDYALIMGSIGLLLILGSTMYFTRNINWYSIKE